MKFKNIYVPANTGLIQVHIKYFSCCENHTLTITNSVSYNVR